MMKNHESQNKIDKYGILIIFYKIIVITMLLAPALFGSLQTFTPSYHASIDHTIIARFFEKYEGSPELLREWKNAKNNPVALKRMCEYLLWHWLPEYRNTHEEILEKPDNIPAHISSILWETSRHLSGKMGIIKHYLDAIARILS